MCKQENSTQNNSACYVNTIFNHKDILKFNVAVEYDNNFYSWMDDSPL